MYSTCCLTRERSLLGGLGSANTQQSKRRTKTSVGLNRWPVALQPQRLHKEQWSFSLIMLISIRWLLGKQTDGVTGKSHGAHLLCSCCICRFLTCPIRSLVLVKSCKGILFVLIQGFFFFKLIDSCWDVLLFPFRELCKRQIQPLQCLYTFIPKERGGLRGTEDPTRPPSWPAYK